jgi:hypothetical protein
VTDWTELLPEGVPADSRFGAKVEARPAVYCMNTSAGVGAVKSPADFAQERFISETPQFNDWAPAIAFDRFAPATLMDYALTFRFAPGITLQTELNEAVLDDSVALGPFADLPATLRNGVDDQVKSLKTAFGNARIYGPGSTTVTPP